MSTRTFDFDGRSLKVGNAGKVLFPDIGLTEGGLAHYYSRVADTMLPHLKGRPISMQRFPNGIDKPGFYAKQAPDHFPEWIDRVTIRVLESGEEQPQVVINNPATLVYLVDQATITPHTWLSCTTDLNHPDKLIFDLDPSKTFESCLLYTSDAADERSSVDLGDRRIIKKKQKTNKKKEKEKKKTNETKK